MRLRNKKTGEIVEAITGDTFEVGGVQLRTLRRNPQIVRYYNSLAELNEEWEDYEEPKEYWYIYADKPQRADCGDILEEDFKAIGNHFEAKEEAEKAVEKLKAWKRLKDNGFRFDHIRSIDGVSIKHKDLDQYTIIAYADEGGCDQKCLDLLFSGEDD